MMGKTENFLSRRRNKDGKVLDLEISIVPVYINSTVVSTQVIYRNLDDIIIKGQNALTFDALANNFLDGIVITNSDRIISYSNKAFNEMSGFTVDEIVGKKPDKIFRSNYHDKFYYENISKAILKKGKWQGELWNKQKDGSIKPYWLQIFSINSEDNITLRYVAIYKDLAGININKKILSMLGKDALTTIPNRTKFIEDVEEAILNFPL